jgi:hypothetical protein
LTVLASFISFVSEGSIGAFIYTFIIKSFDLTRSADFAFVRLTIHTLIAVINSARDTIKADNNEFIVIASDTLAVSFEEVGKTISTVSRTCAIFAIKRTGITSIVDNRSVFTFRTDLNASVSI